MDLRQLTYPAAGFWDYAGNFGSVKEKARVWSCTPRSDSKSVYELYVDKEKANFNTSVTPVGASSVRCVKD